MELEKRHYELINEIMDSFDFHKVAKTMNFLKWKWIKEDVTADCSLEERYYVPEERDIRKKARSFLEAAILKETSISGEGLKANYSIEDGIGYLKLEFILEEDEYDCEEKK